MSDLSVAIVSSGVGKSPLDIPFSFVFDEAIRLKNNGIKVNIIQKNYELFHQSHGLNYGGVSRDTLSLIRFIAKKVRYLPPLALTLFPGHSLSLMEYAHIISKSVNYYNLDLIHAHFAYPEGIAGYIAKTQTKIPLVLMLHGYDILVDKSVGYGVRLDYRVDNIIRKVLKNADAIITASSATYREALRSGALQESTHLIHNAVDVERFHPENNSENIRIKHNLLDKFVLFTVRSHKPKYGLEYAIRAIEMVHKEDKSIHLIIGGDGPLRDYHEKLVDNLGISECVTITGRISATELPEYYTASDVVLVPSLQEAFGLVVAEGMASGKPVIGSAVGGIPDQIVNGTNGFLVSPRCPDAIYEKVMLLATNPTLCKKMGSTGRKIAEQKFDIRDRVNRIINVYKELVQ